MSEKQTTADGAHAGCERCKGTGFIEASTGRIPCDVVVRDTSEASPDLAAVVGQALIAASLGPDEELADPFDHALVTVVDALRKRVLRLEARGRERATGDGQSGCQWHTRPFPGCPSCPDNAQRGGHRQAAYDEGYLAGLAAPRSEAAQPKLSDVLEGIVHAGFRYGPSLHGQPTLWCLDCGRDSGTHYDTCKRDLLNEPRTAEAPPDERCHYCGGSGTVTSIIRGPRPCPDCKGDGKHPKPRDRERGPSWRCGGCDCTVSADVERCPNCTKLRAPNDKAEPLVGRAAFDEHRRATPNASVVPCGHVCHGEPEGGRPYTMVCALPIHHALHRSASGGVWNDLATPGFVVSAKLCPHGLAPGLCFEQPCFRLARESLSSPSEHVSATPTPSSVCDHCEQLKDGGPGFCAAHGSPKSTPSSCKAQCRCLYRSECQAHATDDRELAVLRRLAEKIRHVLEHEDNTCGACKGPLSECDHVDGTMLREALAAADQFTRADQEKKA